MPRMNSSVARSFTQVIAGSGLLVAALSACTGSAGGHASATRPDRPATTAVAPVAATPTASVPVVVADTSGYTGPHFSTPQAAMRYLTGAYNRDDAAGLHAVT